MRGLYRRWPHLPSNEPIDDQATPTGLALALFVCVLNKGEIMHDDSLPDESGSTAMTRRWGALFQQPEKMLANVLAGLIVSLVAIVFNISYAALIFSGPLAPYLPFGISAALISLVVSALVVSFLSSLPILCGGPDSLTAAIVAVIVGNVSTTLVAAGLTDALLPTTLVAFVIATTLTGGVLWAAGKFELGYWVRYIPYPVIGGFLAGTGWLITRGGIKVMSEVPVELGQLGHLMQVDVLILWLPGVLFAVALLAANRFYKHFLIIPGFVLGALVIFYLILAVTGTSLQQAAAIGWLFPPFGETAYYFPLTPTMLGAVNWSVLPAQSASLFALFLITIIDLLLVASGLELALQRPLDLNRELRVTGIANVVTGIFGGFVSCLSTSRTILAHKAGATGRLSGLVVAAIGLIMLFFGDPTVAYIPKPILGGLLLYLGLSLLVQWLYESWRKLQPADYALIWVILLVMGTAGLLPGIAVGIVIASVIFTITYSRISVLKHVLSGADYPSNRARTFQQQRYLSQYAQQIRILWLQGYLFFGTAMQLVEYITTLVEERAGGVRFLILDFYHCSGVDASALLSFTKLQRLAQEHEVVLIYTGLQPALLAQFAKEKIVTEQDRDQTLFADLDRGIEHCEEALLHQGSLQRQRFMPLALQLSELFPETEQINTFMGYLVAQRMKAEETVIAEGEKPTTIYLIEYGQVTISTRLANQQTRRVLTLGSGAILGDWRLPPNGYAVADQRSQIYTLSQEALQRMTSQDPHLAVIFFRFLAQISGEQLVLANTTIDRLLS